MRNRDVHICPVGAAVICFRKPQDWYVTKLLRGRQQDKSITYEMHKASYEAVFKYLGLTFNKKTHINRQQGVRHLESVDVEISQTRRYGRWGMDTCNAVYAAPIAREAMRAMSRHLPRSRLYYLERASVDPTLEL
ncbi:Short-chain dehydrogenase [Phytophthora megakarya]|uniref:Short-chain dehydrogenase n=1 Tax=Phytophthora megakarya TaxID=4795 RepID=A0A225VQ77_9STRA|nr:Short-chain dehydrogenase [Phytophthora megakarya]